jgi:hypothetical protein
MTTITETRQDSWFRPYTAQVQNTTPRTAQQKSGARSGQGAGTTKAVRLARAYSTIVPTHQDMLWRDHIPFADVTLIGGDGGIGKGRLLADLAARISRGDDMLDSSPGLSYPGNVIMVTPEDDPNTSVAWRLAAANANQANVFDMTEMPGGEFSIPGDIPALREEMLRIGDVKLVIIDPLSQVSEKSLTANATVRRFVWGPLRQLAKDTGAAIVVMIHTVKSGEFQGSKGLTDAARVVLKVTRDKQDPRVRVISVFKGNDVDDGAAEVCYTLTGQKPYIKVEYVNRDDEADMEGLSDGERQVLTIVKTRQQAGQLTDAQKVAELLRIRASAASVRLHRMKAKGLVEKEAHGLYRMPA